MASGFQMAEGAQFGDTFVGRGLSDIHQRRDAWLVNYGEDGVAARLYATGGVVGDMIGITGLREGVSGRDAVTGESLGRHERYERAVDGASSLLLTAGMAAAPRVAPWAYGIGSGARVGAKASSFWRNPSRTLLPGPYAVEHIPARSPAQLFTVAERNAINVIGLRRGCHTCGTRSPGTKGRNFIPDHQVVSAINEPGSPQILLPHCIRCSREQGLAVANIRRLARKMLGLQKRGAG